VNSFFFSAVSEDLKADFSSRLLVLFTFQGRCPFKSLLRIK
jgi:hypothetical protein